MTRQRTRTRPEGPTGFAKALAGGLFDTITPAGYVFDECSDVVGNPNGDNPLFLSHSCGTRWRASGIINGWWATTNVASVVSVAGFANYTYTTMAPQVSRPSNNSLLAEGLAKTNPNRPQVDLPVALAEFREIPKLLKDWCDKLISKPSFVARENLNDLPRSTASRHLEWQFGIAPFLKDLGTALQFQKNVQAKLDALEQLGKPGGSVRSGTVYRDAYEHSFVHGPNYATSLYQGSRQVWHRDAVERKSWVSTNWIPTVPLPVTVEDRYLLAIRMAYGLEISLSTIWEAFPWSWLIDWFSNVGDLIGAYRNAVPVKFGNSCLMDYTVLTRNLHHVSFGPGSTLAIEMPRFLYEEKVRTPFGSLLPPTEYNIPFLSGNQVAILSSLLVLRGTNPLRN
jgi:hypothetical protein